MSRVYRIRALVGVAASRRIKGKSAMTSKEAYIIADKSPQRPVEAAPGVAASDAHAVNRKEGRDLYAARKKIYPKLAHGTFRNLKWAVMVLTLGVYYALPWLRWNSRNRSP